MTEGYGHKCGGFVMEIQRNSRNVVKVGKKKGNIIWTDKVREASSQKKET